MQQKNWVTTALGMAIPLYMSLAVSPMWAQQPRAQHPKAAANSIVLQGEVHGAQNNSYVEVPFDVPSGTKRVTLTFDYTGKDQRTALDLGLMDPTELRCWSGGNKKLLTVGISDATPSCLPGPIPTGKWKVLIGVPNIRPQMTSHYTCLLYTSPSPRD